MDSQGQALLAGIIVAAVYFGVVQPAAHGAVWLGKETKAAVHYVIHRAAHHPLGKTPKSEKK